MKQQQPMEEQNQKKERVKEKCPYKINILLLNKSNSLKVGQPQM
jgi:hypothetical protein